MVISANSSLQTLYILNQARTSFEQAKATCSPGVLTTLTTEQELQQINEHLSTLTQDKVTAWVGLMKFKNECTTLMEPLRGFRWLDGSSPVSQVVGWLEEPLSTCTEVLCAVLRRRSKGELGLIAVSCKDRYQFICKQTGRPPQSRQTTMTPTEPEPTTRPVTLKPDPVTSWPSLPAPAPGPETEPSATSGNDPDSCQLPTIPENRSLKLDSSNNSRIQVECWSNIKLDLFCLGRPAVWRMLDGSLADFSSICRSCDLGFQKDDSGHCIDIDECLNGPCRSTEKCLNTDGSYRCICANHTHNATCNDPGMTEDNQSLAGILVPVLVAVAVLLVLLVLIAVVVKCCLMRREKKHAREEAEMKMKEAT